ncbi:hypothetical protein [Janibacter sp. LM]|uniref:hypothetical protein n=1 Tax=Janibacter sp. LM TaxID=3144845 RepID=UPI0031F6DAC3
MANRRLEESAYAKSLEVTARVAYTSRWKYLDQEPNPPTIGDAMAAMEPVRIYGDPEAVTAGERMLTGLTDAWSSKDGSTASNQAWEVYSDARSDYVAAVRQALKVSQ